MGVCSGEGLYMKGTLIFKKTLCTVFLLNCVLLNPE